MSWFFFNRGKLAGDVGCLFRKRSWWDESGGRAALSNPDTGNTPMTDRQVLIPSHRGRLAQNQVLVTCIHPASSVITCVNLRQSFKQAPNTRVGLVGSLAPNILTLGGKTKRMNGVISAVKPENGLRGPVSFRFGNTP